MQNCDRELTYLSQRIYCLLISTLPFQDNRNSKTTIINPITIISPILSRYDSRYDAIGKLRCFFFVVKRIIENALFNLL